ncbi:AAA family ATPase [Flavobacteriaceae bacterium]|nr:AAA family ATPase [Flavobacteriaceae bacterium]
MLTKHNLFFQLLFFCFFIGRPNPIQVVDDNQIKSKIDVYKNNTHTYLYISKNNKINPFYLDLADKYLDSILILDQDNMFGLETRKSINLTRSTIEQNVINKFQLFDFFSGIPNFFGFVDDPIEYAYDDALEKLVNTKYIKLHNGPLSDSNITSLLIRKSCDDEMFEIINQTLVSNTKHHILQKSQLAFLFDPSTVDSLVNGNINNQNIEKILNHFNLDRLGLFTVSTLDVIDEKVWLVNTEFKTYSKEEGFTEPIFTKGYSIDKRNYNYVWIIKFLFIFILSTLLLMGIVNFIISGIKSLFVKTETTQIQIFDLTLNEVWSDFKKHLSTLLLPLGLSFLMIFVCSFIIPGGEEHFLEFNVLIWVFCLTFSVSFLPIVINLFFINRLNFDGFHTIKGYSHFVSSSILPTYLPFFVFYSIKYEISFLYEVYILVCLIVISYMIGQIYGHSFFDLIAQRKSKSNNILSIVGIVIGFITLYIINQLIISEFTLINLLYGIVLSVCSSIIFFVLKKYFDCVEEKNKLFLDRLHQQEEFIFVKSVIDVDNKIFNHIHSNGTEDLDIYIINAPAGIGKTSILKEAKSKFIDEKWNWFYGDCDEIQSVNSVSFEPFFEAFTALLDTDKLIDRTAIIDKLTSKFINTTLDKTIGINPIDELKINPESSINNMCLEITEKLNTLEGNILFIMEDLHWIDSETFSFLKYFLKTINRYDTLRKRFSVVFTLRSNLNENYRGVNYQELMDELNKLNSTTVNHFNIKNLITVDDFEIKNFLLGVNEINTQKIAPNSLNELNDMFNSMIKEKKGSTAILTPLYIQKMVGYLIKNEVLKRSPEGYILVKSLEIDMFPNMNEVDLFYHKIFDVFEKKWIRLLESATIIGSKFDADVISQMWDYNLLEVLTFLEDSVEKGILIDLSEEDNFYEFKDKRIISAVRSYFKDDLIQFRGEKQIIIEYNKRYLEFVNDQLLTPERFSIEDVLKVIRRLITLRFIENYFEQLSHLILDVILRYLYNYQHEKINVFGKFLKKNNLDDIGDLIIDLSIIVNHFDSTDEKKRHIVETIKEDHLKTNQIPINQKHTRNLLNDLRLLILLNAPGSWEESKRNLTKVKSLGFEYLDFSTNDWIYLTNNFLHKLKGIAKLHYTKEYLKDLLTSSCLITDFEYDITYPELKKKYESIFQEIATELKDSDFEYIFQTEYKLYELNYPKDSISTNEESSFLNSLDVPVDEEKDDEFDFDDELQNETNSTQDEPKEKLNQYKQVLDEIIPYEDKALFSKALNGLMYFTNFEYRSYKESINSFLSYHTFLLQDDSVTELWVIMYLNFLNSTTCTCKKTFYKNQCNCDKTGEIYLTNHTKDVEKNLKLVSDYLSKIIESNTLSSISNLLYEVKKVFYLKNDDQNNFLTLIDVQKEKIINTYTQDTSELKKFLVNNSLQFTTLGFYKKSNTYIREAIKIIKKDVVDNSYPATHFSLSQQYFGLSINYKATNNLDSALKNLKLSYTTLINYFEKEPPKGWEIIKNNLTPITIDPEHLYLYGNPKKIKVKKSIFFLSRVFQEFGTIYHRLDNYELSNQYYKEAMTYIHEEYSYSRYHLINLLRGINYKIINTKKGDEIIKSSINKLKLEFVPEHDKSVYHTLKIQIDKLIQSTKK